MPTVLENMELAELSKRLSFLDEERRKDKETIATLIERLEAQTGQLQAQARQVQELEGVLASTRAELVKFTKIERAMEQLRQELTLVIETSEEKREKAYRELNRLRQVEQDTVTRQIAELRKELKPIPRYDEEIQSVQVELGRLNAAAVSLQHQLSELDKRTEDRVQSVIYLEEQRRHDNRRITQTEAEIVTLRKEHDELEGRIPLLEQAIQVKNKEIDRAADLLEEQAQLIENQRVSEFRWERQIAEWGKLVEEIKQENANMITQTVQLREQNQLIRRALADLEQFRERIERRQDEMAEMQRIAEDRQKRVLEEWQTAREKEWDRFKLASDERWRENARFNEQRHTRLEAVEEFVRSLRAQIDALWGIQEAWSQAIMIGPREWTATYGDLVKKRPSMPEPLKPVTITTEEKPMIRPLPSAQVIEEENEEEEE